MLCTPRHLVLRLPALLLSFSMFGLSAGRNGALDRTAVDNVIDRIERHYNRVQTLSVHFIENYQQLGRPRPAEEGKLTLRKQGRMRWDYSHPEGKLFISDGKTLYLYTATDNRVERLPLKQADDLRAPLAFLLGRVDLRRQFRDFSLEPELRGVSLSAAASTGAMPYASVVMRVQDNGSINRLQIRGRDQSIVTLQLEGEQVNPTLPSSLFQFQIPAGAQVVDGIAEQRDAQ